MTTEISDIGSVDLARYIRPGDLVVWGQGCAEPLSLTEALAYQRKQLGGVRCFTGITESAAVTAENCDYLSFASYTAAGANRALAKACWRSCRFTTPSFRGSWASVRSGQMYSSFRCRPPHQTAPSGSALAPTMRQP